MPFNETINNALTRANKGEICGYAMPSDEYIDLTLGSSGSTYTAPANGWFLLRKMTSANNQYISMKNLNNIMTDDRTGFSGAQLTGCLQTLKGQKVNITYTATGSTNNFRFIYAQGEIA